MTIEPDTLTATEARLLAMAYDRWPDLKDLDLHALVSIIRAEIEAVERFAGGPTESETFLHTGYRPVWIHLIRPAVAILGVEERWRSDDPVTMLTPADYRLVDGQRLLRVNAATWGQEVLVDYTAVVDQEVRDQVVLELVQLAVSFRAYGRQSETIGDYQLTTDAADHEARRTEILATISEGRAIFF
jgi:hypothetical protein